MVNTLLMIVALLEWIRSWARFLVMTFFTTQCGITQMIVYIEHLGMPDKNAQTGHIHNIRQ